MNNQEEFLKMIQETFRIEAKENIDLITANLLELEKGHEPEKRPEILETTFRAAHSLKGAARAVDNSPIEKICQALENVFSGLKDGSLRQHSAMFDTFHETVNLINEILGLQITTADNEMQNKIDGMIDRLNDIVLEKFSPQKIVDKAKPQTEKAIQDQKEPSLVEKPSESRRTKTRKATG